MEQPDTPVLDVLSERDTERRAIIEFLEWLREDGITLARWSTEVLYSKHSPDCPRSDPGSPDWSPDSDGRCCYGIPVRGSPRLAPAGEHDDPLVFRYLGLDPCAVEAERRAVLDYARSL